MSTLRKVLIGILLLAFVGAAGYAIYYVFFRPAAPITGPVTNVNALPGGNLPVAGGANANANGPYVPPSTGGGNLVPASPVAKGGPTVTETLVAAPTLGAILSADGKTQRYYDRSTGKFMIVDANGNIKELSSQVFPDVQSVVWSPSGNKVVMTFPDGSKLVYDFAVGKQATLPSSWDGFSFSPGSDKLAAKQESDNASNRYLVVSNADGTGVKPIEPLGDNGDKVTVAWSPAGDVVALSQTGDVDMSGGFGEKQTLFIGTNHENFPATVVDGLDFQPLWSPQGNYLLYSSAPGQHDFKPELYVVTGQGDNRGSGRRDLGIATFVDKCTFAADTIVYCAVPDSMPEGIGLERDALGNVPDSVWKINVVTGTVALIGRPDTDTMISRLSVSADGSVLYFTDQNTGSIKKMALK